jgi:methylmalonyl-CoA/ethylmalonyl-CoA epimerase
MPSSSFAHICLLVNDLDKAVEDWTTILEVLQPEQLEKQVVRYEEFEGGEDSMRWATFVSDVGAEIQLMEPAADSPLGRRLAKYGEGAHHICLTVDDPEDALKKLADKGIAVGDGVSSDPDMPWQRWGWVMPSSTHGTLVEVARPYKAVDGKWENGSDD